MVKNSIRSLNDAAKGFLALLTKEVLKQDNLFKQDSPKHKPSTK